MWSPLLSGCGHPLLGGHWGLLETANHRKNHSKLLKKIVLKLKTSCKTIKTNKFSHLSFQNSDRSNAVVTSGAYRGF